VVRRTFRGATIPSIEDLEEVPMLEETLREWQDRARQEGLKEGLKEGQRKGLIEGQRKGLLEGLRKGREERLKGHRRIVLRLIKHRFGKVPNHVKARIDAISSVRELEKIADRVMTVPSLAEMGFD
jgi:flagellar biosynthesis/type III secretory pathway protein FliH